MYRDPGLRDSMDSIEVTMGIIIAACSNSIGFTSALFHGLRRGRDPCFLDVVIAQRKSMRSWVSKLL